MEIDIVYTAAQILVLLLETCGLLIYYDMFDELPIGGTCFPFVTFEIGAI